VTGLKKQPYNILESELLKARQSAEPLSIMIIKVRDLAGLKKTYEEKYYLIM